MTDDHETLCQAARSGDSSAIDELLGRHLDGLRAFVRLRAGGVIRARESCSDLAQSVCREVLEDADQFEYRGEAAFRSWLYEKALNKIRDRARYWYAQKRDVRRQCDVANEDDAANDASVLGRYYASNLTPSRVAIGHETVDHVEQAFDRLPEEQREALVLSRVVGLGTAAIAEQMGRSEGSVRGLLDRGLARLAWILSRDARGDGGDPPA